MAVGDVTVTIVEGSSGIDTALTAIRAACGANGEYGIVQLDMSHVAVWGIEEAP